MRKVVTFMKPYKVAAVVAALLMLVELAVELWLPLFMADIIDNGIAKENLSLITELGIWMIVLTVISFVASIINTYLASYVSQHFGFDLRKALFEKVQSFAFADFNRFPTSSLLTRLTNDVNQVQLVVFMGLRIMVRAPLLVVGGVVMAFVVDVQLALLLTAAIPLVIVFLYFVMKKGVPLFSSVQEKLDRVNGVMRENLVGVRLIKAYLRSKHEQQRFKQVNENLMSQTVTSLRLIELATPVLLILMNVAIVAVLWFGGVKVVAGTAQVGEISAIITYGTRITVALTMFSFILMLLSRARASAYRMQEVLQTETYFEKESGVKPAALEKLEFQHVSFRYPNSEEDVLRDLSFTAEKGQLIGVMGATGSGKSSMIQLIPRLYEPTEGNVLFNGVNETEVHLDELRSRIGVVPQEVVLFSGTIGDNIRWGKEDASREEVETAAKAAQIHSFILTLPNQYDTVLGQKGINLSGGQKQRLSIARALIRNPEILILDDSTSALDLNTEAQLQQALKDQESMILLIAQKISSIKEADKIILLEDGAIIGEGTHDHLLEKSDVYREIYVSQYGEEAAHELKQKTL
ncbi:ATP-binding cassette domain-containing protein [Bacillus hwajinpoensis]|uniref:ATP-binding cassette domain-containing protein n=1 Tax=Guptibacillus hwajinpoensis TaxID=208199 RepID=A0A845ETT7_9BACL|nr:ABC transporter ATP-binding protein [Pseudalkalibacillus hwajinpoensis]MYL62013.1 ATP-binding cassette domain-containing protein [Pseudalkalibacillus hwajinpoensis]